MNEDRFFADSLLHLTKMFETSALIGVAVLGVYEVGMAFNTTLEYFEHRSVDNAGHELGSLALGVGVIGITGAFYAGARYFRQTLEQSAEQDTK